MKRAILTAALVLTLTACGTVTEENRNEQSQAQTIRGDSVEVESSTVDNSIADDEDFSLWIEEPVSYMDLEQNERQNRYVKKRVTSRQAYTSNGNAALTVMDRYFPMVENGAPSKESGERKFHGFDLPLQYSDIIPHYDCEYSIFCKDDGFNSVFGDGLKEHANVPVDQLKDAVMHASKDEPVVAGIDYKNGDGKKIYTSSSIIMDNEGAYYALALTGNLEMKNFGYLFDGMPIYDESTGEHVLLDFLIGEYGFPTYISTSYLYTRTLDDGYAKLKLTGKEEPQGNGYLWIWEGDDYKIAFNFIESFLVHEDRTVDFTYTPQS